MVNLVVRDEGVAGVADDDGNASAIFGPDVAEEIVLDAIVGGEILDGRKRSIDAAELDAIAGDIGEDAALD